MTIILDKLTIGYRTGTTVSAVAKDICGEIRGGEMTCLLGANGVGKSTLLRTLAAFLPKLGGTVSFEGRDISEFKDSELARRIAVVLTEKPEISNMTVRELVALGRSPYTGFWGSYTAADLEIVDKAMAMTGIEELSGRMTDTLSDGERQKTMIAKAIAQQTPVIILDEPTAFLDFPSKVETMRLLHRVSRDTGKTIFLSTHDLELALQMSDTVWLMEKGKEMTVGTPEDLSLDGRLAGFFAGRGISFDADTGLFRADEPVVTTVSVCGDDGVRRKMVVKALKRNGIGTKKYGMVTGESPHADVEIDIKSDCFAVRHAAGDTAVGTIRELIAALQALRLCR
ncbi:MAG: ABC transporter ATP-binding protein [Prevotella sp.]|nr:ABC transporter ATP-binding protein [Prevotella sp.]